MDIMNWIDAYAKAYNFNEQTIGSVDDRTRMAISAMTICVGLVVMWVGYRMYQDEKFKKKIQELEK